jgi:hypothetical protein
MGKFENGLIFDYGCLFLSITFFLLKHYAPNKKAKTGARMVFDGC